MLGRPEAVASHRRTAHLPWLGLVAALLAGCSERPVDKPATQMATGQDGGGGCMCGDGQCDPKCAEALDSCPFDCKACGDGVCSPSESPNACAVDCCGACGDGKCKGYGCGESPSVCPSDCGTACGNKTCDKGESPATCAVDCQWQACGNGTCEPSDGGPGKCAADCGAACGNCTCEKGETFVDCPIDCGFCGDGVCSPCAGLHEAATTCATDCKGAGGTAPGVADGAAASVDAGTAPLDGTTAPLDGTPAHLDTGGATCKNDAGCTDGKKCNTGTGLCVECLTATHCAPKTCNTATNTCVATCSPTCAGKQCGDNGCGGTCGSCEAGKDCLGGVCL